MFLICKRKYISAYSAGFKVPIPQMSTQIAQPVRESTVIPPLPKLLSKWEDRKGGRLKT